MYFRVKVIRMSPHQAIVAIFLAVLMPGVFHESDRVDFAINIRVIDQDSKATKKDISILILDKDGSRHMKTDPYGKLRLTLAAGSLTDLVVNEGAKLSKLIRLDARNFDLSNWRYKEINHFTLRYEFEIMLFEPEWCEKYEFLKDTPVIHYVFDPRKKDMVDIAAPGILKRIEKERKKSCTMTF